VWTIVAVALVLAPFCAGEAAARGGPKPIAQCNDHRDNDGDGYCDFASKRGYCSDGSKLGDPKCGSATDPQESCTPVAETCNGVDDDCDGEVDEEGVCSVTYYCDADLDGYTSASPSGSCSSYRCTPPGCSGAPGADCRDDLALVHPGAAESCDANGVDDDCDDTVDECDTCRDGVRDGDETAVDCGGSCSGCDVGGTCLVAADCLSGLCESGTCKQPASDLDPRCRPIKYDYAGTANHVNLVLVPSAFNGDMELFRQKAQWIASVFGAYEPFGSTIATYNVFYVTQESGDYCHFGCNGIDRLLCCDTSIARTLSSVCTTGSRQTIVVQNSDTYGGAGYASADVATTSTHASAPRVAVHELGHSLFDLGDEYSYGNATPAKPNCDYAGCSKWQDMLGYNGVSCTSGACANGAYYASENTLMKALNYPFEEVNLRLSCCAYGRETGAYPAYCDQFARFTPSGSLSDFCSVPSSSTVAAVPSEYLDDPEEITFVRVPGSGHWSVESVERRRPGFYPMEKTRGQGHGGIRVGVDFAGGERRELRFEKQEDVEFPGLGDAMGGTTKRRRQALSVVVDRHGRGPVVGAQARERR
jgi:hypothetical protein